MKGVRRSVRGVNGVDIGLLTAGAGPTLLLVHGGMGRIESWGQMWDLLTERWRVTAMDRRGRGSSGDSEPYAIEMEFGDIAAVASHLADEQGKAIDVFGHSYGATCTLGAAALVGAPFCRIALYEPPGPPTVPEEWVERASAFATGGQPGRAMMSFLTEIIGLSTEQIEALRSTPGAQDILPVVAATLPREAAALTQIDLERLAASVTAPVLFLLGDASPKWAGEITRALAAQLPNAETVILTGCGHEALDTAPASVTRALKQFLDSRGGVTLDT